MVKRRRFHLSGGGEDAECDRKIETAALLRQVGGRQVDGDAALGKFELRGDERRAHPVARLAHLGVGQADQVEGRQAVGQMNFDRHLGRGKTVQRTGAHDGERHRNSGPQKRASLAEFRNIPNR